MKDYAVRLKALRIEHGLTQQEVADYLKVNKQTVSGYERGVRKPDFERLDDLAELFDVSIAYLVGSQEERGHYPGHQPDIITDYGLLETKHAHDEADSRRVVKAYLSASEEIREAVRRVLGID